jgi:hypothetical protein
VAFLGNILLVTGTFIDAFVLPSLALELPEAFEAPPVPIAIALSLTYLLFVLGYVLFGTAVIRSGVLPRWASLMLAVGSPLFAVGVTTVQALTVVGALLFGVGWAWLGYASHVGSGRIGTPGPTNRSH